MTKEGIPVKSKIMSALDMAREAHFGQYRKLRDDRGQLIPYVDHPIEVAEQLYRMIYLLDINVDDDMFAAALLHDTVEDTEVTVHDIRMTFGHRIANMVSDLTKPENENWNRKESLWAYCDQLLAASKEAQIIKAVDIFCNARDTKGGDPAWIKRFVGEKLLMLTRLTDIPLPLYNVVHDELRRIKNEL